MHETPPLRPVFITWFRTAKDTDQSCAVLLPENNILIQQKSSEGRTGGVIAFVHMCLQVWTLQMFIKILHRFLCFNFYSVCAESADILTFTVSPVHTYTHTWHWGCENKVALTNPRCWLVVGGSQVFCWHHPSRVESIQCDKLKTHCEVKLPGSSSFEARQRSQHTLFRAPD